jgi:hypothetical protein
MYDGALTGDLDAAGRSPRGRYAAGDRRSPGMRNQVPQRGVVGRHQLRDVIAEPARQRQRTKAPKPSTFLRSLPRSNHAFAPSKPWYPVQVNTQQQRTG